MSVGEEDFSPAYHGAGDVTRYSFVKDIERLERISYSDGPLFCCAILLTNDSSFWEPPLKTGFNYDAFRVHEGLLLSGNMQWALGGHPKAANEGHLKTGQRESPGH